ncbi:hypothetical protein CAter10_1217 [Collimonas arenae]|nr:hypothetical protein CAter10_1217 [Collimonas arenae]
MKTIKVRSVVLACALFGLAHVLCQAADVSPATGIDGFNGYAAASLGNGIIYGLGTTGQKPMRWRAAEIRFGQDVDLFGLRSSGYLSQGDTTRLDVVYYNEGHPDNNHRDGYALQMVFRKKLQPHLDLELGGGPYFSMNRSTINGTELDDGRMGALLSVALLARLDQYSPGLSIRIGYNHAVVPGAPSSDALLVGIGKEFGGGQASAPDLTERLPVWLSASGGFAQTNQSGPGKRFSYALDAKTYFGQWAASVSGIEEGDDGVRVNRRGIAAQGWYVQPITENWSLSAGAGPYLATNKRQSDSTTLNGLFTIQLDRNLGKNWKVFGSFGRAVTFTNKNDADLMTVGLSRRFDF